MSRIGRLPITVPAGVTVDIKDNTVTVNGKLGTLIQEVDSRISVEKKDGEIQLTRENENVKVKALHGLYRAIVANMIHGVNEGFSKKLVIKGVGYKALMQGNDLVLNIGYSHTVTINGVEGIKIECPSITEIVISGINKEKVGQMAAKIRLLKPVEPYHGYGVRYDDEVVVRKQGKTAAKK